MSRALIPNQKIYSVYLLRAALLWLAVRALVSVILLLAKINPLDLSVATVVQVILVSVFVCVIDSYRRRERVLLGNLGVHPYVLWALFAVPALVGELLIGVAGPLVT